MSIQLDSSRVSAANESDVELHARREISYLQAAMYYFVDHINTMGVIFNTQNPQLVTWSLSTIEIFQVHGQNWPVANLPIVDFRP